MPTGHSHVALQYAPSQGIATTIAAVSDQLRELDGVRPSQGAREPKVLAQQYGAGNLPVNSVNIGFVTTPPVGEHPPSAHPSSRSTILHGAADEVTLERFGTVEEVSGIVAFLAGSRSSYITGAVIDVAGRPVEYV